MRKKLFAVYLGGRAPNCNIELHDVVFAVGEKIEDTYEELMDKWFGTPLGLHLDSYMELDVVDGHRVKIVDNLSDSPNKLYFVNLGAYATGQFTEIHASKFIVCSSKPEAKVRAKKELLQDWGSPVHTDDLYEIDDCIEIRTDCPAHHIALEKTVQVENFRPVNGYHLIPKAMVENYMSRKEGVTKMPAGANRWYETK
jgi:hypothetical protein